MTCATFDWDFQDALVDMTKTVLQTSEQFCTLLLTLYHIQMRCLRFVDSARPKLIHLYWRNLLHTGSAVSKFVVNSLQALRNADSVSGSTTHGVLCCRWVKSNRVGLCLANVWEVISCFMITVKWSYGPTQNVAQSDHYLYAVWYVCMILRLKSTCLDLILPLIICNACNIIPRLDTLCLDLTSASSAMQCVHHHYHGPATRTGMSWSDLHSNIAAQIIGHYKGLQRRCTCCSCRNDGTTPRKDSCCRDGRVFSVNCLRVAVSTAEFCNVRNENSCCHDGR